jgi:quercetin dioxygenase-like cupin family protein
MTIMRFCKSGSAPRCRTATTAVLPACAAVGAWAAPRRRQVGGDTHKVLLENAQVRVLAVRIKAGEKVPMHSHPARFLVLSDGKLRIRWRTARPWTKEPKAGAATWSDAVTHAVENSRHERFQPGADRAEERCAGEVTGPRAGDSAMHRAVASGRIPGESHAMSQSSR